jgi:hypothetical protein
MNAMTLGLFVNTSLLAVSLTAVSKWHPSGIVQQAVQGTHEEYLLQVCGALAAGLANLKDALDQSTKQQQKKLSLGYNFILNNFHEQQEAGKLPSHGQCEKKSPDGRIFTFKLYRLNEVDQPNRRINWHYRISQKQTI